MSNTNFDFHTLLDYSGDLSTASITQTPFLTALGGINGMQQVNTFTFPTTNSFSLNTAAQTVYTETESLTAQDRTNRTLTQVNNTCQIMMYKVQVSYKALGDKTMNGIVGSGGTSVITNWYDQQVAFALMEMARDTEYSFINGSYVSGANITTAAQTRGIVEATSTNAVAAGGADLDKDMLDELFRTMAAANAPFVNPVILCGAFNKQKITDIYASVPTDRNYGGANIKTVEMDFGPGIVGVAWSPFITTSTVQVVEMSECYPVVNPIPDKGGVFIDVLGTVGASVQGNLYGQVGLSYGLETNHGKITGTSTS